MNSRTSSLQQQYQQPWQHLQRHLSSLSSICSTSCGISLAPAACILITVSSDSESLAPEPTVAFTSGKFNTMQTTLMHVFAKYICFIVPVPNICLTVFRLTNRPTDIPTSAWPVFSLMNHAYYVNTNLICFLDSYIMGLGLLQLLRLMNIHVDGTV